MDNQFNPQPTNPSSQPPTPNQPLQPNQTATPTTPPGGTVQPGQTPQSTGPNLNFKAPSVSLGGGSFNVNKPAKDNKGGKKKKILIVLLTIILLAAIGAAGYFLVLKKDKQEEPTNNTPTTQVEDTQTEPEQPATSDNDETADWQALTNKEGKFSLKHPKSWVLAANIEACTPTITLLGANATSVGKCGSEDLGQMAVSSLSGNAIGEVILVNTEYSDLKSAEAMADGIKGTRQTGTYSGPVNDIGPQKGDKIVQYTFIANNRTYTATYNIIDKAPDALKDFDTLVTKTLKFTK